MGTGTGSTGSGWSPLDAPLGGWPSSPAWVTLDVVQALHADRAGIERRQRRRLRDLLSAARERVPRYRQLLQGVDLDRVQLSQLPRNDKPSLMADFEAHLADPAISLGALQAFCADPAQVGLPYLGRCWAWESSGSTGLPALFVQDSAAMAVYDALESCRRHNPDPWRRWLDPWYLAERFAFVGATAGHFASIVSVQRLRRRQPWLQSGWRCFSILQPLPALCAALDEFAPTLLATYPTAAVALAAQVEAGVLRNCRPREVWTGGEALTPTMRGRIESAFGCAVQQSYGASEFLPIAWQCRHGALHVNADWVILEPVDAQGRPVPAGTRSHSTLLTNLANRLQPLIRFDIGDRIVLDERACACGSALPTVRVQGRCDDVLEMAGAGRTKVSLLPLALTTVLEEQAGLFDFELRQTDAHRLRLGIGPAAAAGPAAMRRYRRVLTDFLREQGVVRPTLELHRLDRSPLHMAAGRSGKCERVLGRPGAGKRVVAAD